MALLTDEELMPRWVALGLAEAPDVLPEIPDWLRDAPLTTEEPLCDCGCGRPRAELEDRLTPSPIVPQDQVTWAIPGVWDEEPAPVKPSVGELVERLDDVVDQLASCDPALLPPGQPLGEAAALTRVQHQLRVLQLARTKGVKDRKLFEHLGFRSSTAWQQQVAPDAPASDLALARQLPDLPHLHVALASQRMSFTAAAKVKTALGKARPALDRPDGLIDGQPGEATVEAVVWNVLDLAGKDRFGLEHDPGKDPLQAAFLADLEARLEAILHSGVSQHDRVEQSMVLLAELLHPKNLKAALDEIVDQLVPSKLEDQDKAAQDKRSLGLSPNSDGTWHLEGTLTPEAGEQLHAALSAEARRDPANPLDTHAREQARIAEADGRDAWEAAEDRPEWERRALRETGDRFLPDGDQLVPRSRSKRLHDAFGRMVTRYLEHGLGGVSGKVPVQVMVTASHRTVEGAPERRLPRAARAGHSRGPCSAAGGATRRSPRC